MALAPAVRGAGLCVQWTITYLQKKAENITFGFPGNPDMKDRALI